jgi:hypothetical protein
VTKLAAENIDTVAQQPTQPATIIQRARLYQRSLTASDVRQLQRTMGNQATGRLLAQTVLNQLKELPLEMLEEIKEEGEAAVGEGYGTGVVERIKALTVPLVTESKPLVQSFF